MTPAALIAEFAVLAGLLDAWLDAQCIRALTDPPGIVIRCVGENHLAVCPVELARQDIIAWRNAWRIRSVPR